MATYHHSYDKWNVTNSHSLLCTGTATHAVQEVQSLLVEARRDTGKKTPSTAATLEAFRRRPAMYIGNGKLMECSGFVS
eukprot:scaffold309457_cov19-Prasinocladus_malaysianus.AAC.1